MFVNNNKNNNRLFEKISKALLVVTFEPTLIFYAISISMSRFLSENLLLRKACDPDLLEEPDLNIVGCLRQVEAQHRVANINTWKALLLTLLPTVILLIAGPWTDQHGNRRRPLIFIPIIGQIVTDLCCSLNAYFWHWTPEIAAVFETVLPGFTGSETLLLAGTLCYVCDVTDEKSRTVRISVITVLYLTCGPLGAGLAGLVNVKFGFIASFFLTASLNVIALTLAFFFITDVSKPYDESKCSLFDTVNLANQFGSLLKMATKPRPRAMRLILNLAVFLKAIASSRLTGESSVLYLFVSRQFQWKEVDYSIFTAYKMVTILIGTLLSIGLLSRCLKINDALIGIIGTTVDTVAAVLYFMVASPFQMYLIPLVDMFHGAAITLAASISTKCVESDELGKLNTMQAVLSALFPIIVSPIYSQVYSFTFEKIPPMFFLISIVISIPAVVLFSIIYYTERRQNLIYDNSPTTTKEQIGNCGSQSAAKLEQSSPSTKL